MDQETGRNVFSCFYFLLLFLPVCYAARLPRHRRPNGLFRSVYVCICLCICICSRSDDERNGVSPRSRPLPVLFSPFSSDPRLVWHLLCGTSQQQSRTVRPGEPRHRGGRKGGSATRLGRICGWQKGAATGVEASRRRKTRREPRRKAVRRSLVRLSGLERRSSVSIQGDKALGTGGQFPGPHEKEGSETAKKKKGRLRTGTASIDARWAQSRAPTYR